MKIKRREDIMRKNKLIFLGATKDPEECFKCKRETVLRFFNGTQSIAICPFCVPKFYRKIHPTHSKFAVGADFKTYNGVNVCVIYLCRKCGWWSNVSDFMSRHRCDSTSIFSG